MPETPPPVLNPSDVTALAVKLQETAQALLALCQAPVGHDGSGELQTPPESNADGTEPAFEIRSYEIPGCVLRDERDLLKRSSSEDLLDVLNKVHAHIYCMASLMKQVDPQDDVRGVLVNGMAEILLIPLDWLEQLCGTLAEFRLVSHIKTGSQN